MSRALAQEQTVLDLASHVALDRPVLSFRRLLPLIVGGAAATLVVVVAAMAHPYFRAGDETGVLRIELEQQKFIASLNVDDKGELLVEGSDAQTRNAEIPLLEAPVERVDGFVAVPAGGGTFGTALRCLTQAVYYEAAVEPLQGRRAVAQVVLNRMRHSAYPNSVCGVVYQGSARRTGCQFSFTCDGSLLRTPSPEAWKAAERVARAALVGYVEPSVGTATHYHADYVLPKWAFQLGKIDQIGRHIFYRFRGGWGRASALTASYSGHELIPTLNFAAMRERLGNQDIYPAAIEAHVPGLTVPPSITDRHAPNDVGGRLDTTKAWRLTIPDPTEASTRYRTALGDDPLSPSGRTVERTAVAPGTDAEVPMAVAAPITVREVARQ